jgi:hypothetical protein
VGEIQRQLEKMGAERNRAQERVCILEKVILILSAGKFLENKKNISEGNRLKGLRIGTGK